MKIKITLTALLLAAFMVTPSYGIDFSDSNFQAGAEDFLASQKGNRRQFSYDMAYFIGYVNGYTSQDRFSFPNAVTNDKKYEAVARYIQNHPAERFETNNELIRRAVKQTWPRENHSLVLVPSK